MASIQGLKDAVSNRNGSTTMNYFRLHVSYTGKTGKPVGIFGACHHLKRFGKLSSEEQKLFEEVDAWYTEHLPEPPFYKNGNPQRAIAWFKDTPEERKLTQRLTPLVELLQKYRDDYTVTRSSASGEIVYEDDFQIATL